MRVSNLIKELPFLFFRGIFHLCTLRLLSVELFSRLSMLLDLHLNEGDLLVSILNLSLDLRVIQEPLGQEVNWLLGLLLVHHGHTFGDDRTQVFTLDIVSV